MCTYVVILAQIWGIKSGDVAYVGVVQCLFFVEQFNQLCEGYDLVDHKIFCIVTNEGGAFISVADLIIVVNTNICSWVTHSCRGSDGYLKVIRMSLVGSDIYRICRLHACVHCAVTCTVKWHVSLLSTWSRGAIRVNALSSNNKKIA